MEVISLLDVKDSKKSLFSVKYECFGVKYLAENQSLPQSVVDQNKRSIVQNALISTTDGVALAVLNLAQNGLQILLVLLLIRVDEYSEIEHSIKQ